MAATRQSTTTFQKWLDTFIEEKGIDTEKILEVPGPGGMNFIPVGSLLDIIKFDAPQHEQMGIKTMIVKIDFLNGDVLDYFKHLAKAIAL